MEDDLGLPDGAFRRIDEEDDALFYEAPRLVYHIDENAVAALTDFYRRVLPEGGVLLDLMSSWVSHLPPEIGYAEIIGHGMNEAELAANPRLGRRFVQDLNNDPRLPLDDDSIDAAMICVSVQYLQHPVAVLREVARVLRPGGPVVISFSNRCFWTKAVAIWRGLDDAGHARLVELYLREAGFERHRDASPRGMGRGRTRSADRGRRPGAIDRTRRRRGPDRRSALSRASPKWPVLLSPSHREVYPLSGKAPSFRRQGKHRHDVNAAGGIPRRLPAAHFALV